MIYKVSNVIYLMKMRFEKLILLVLFLAGFSSAALVDDCNNVYSNQMEAYFRFNDNLDDVVGQVTATNSNPAYSSGISGNGISLNSLTNFDDGSGNYITFSSTNPQFTIMFWYDSSSEGEIISLTQNDFLKVGYREGKIVVDLTTSAGSTSVSKDYSGSGLVFISIVWDNTDLSLYLASQSDSSLGSSTASRVSPSGGSIPGNGKISFIQGSGIIDEFAVYSDDLSESFISGAFSKSKAGNNYCYASTGESSLARTEFSIAGCKIVGSTGEVEYSLSKGSCSRDGLVYCGLDGVAYDTLLPNNGCSLGSETWEVGNSMCCPSTHICTSEEDGSGGTSFACNLPETDCAIYSNDRSSCSDNGCYWFEIDSGTEEGTCISNPKDQSCSVYKDENSCNQDNYNIGGTGVGADVCDTLETGFFDLVGVGQFIIPESSCGCKWDSATSVCELSWTMTEALFETDATPSSFDCLTDFSIGKCLVGEQLIQWTTRTTNVMGVFSNQNNLDTARTESRCVDGELIRNCGETILKFPGFSLFALFLSMILIAGFYLIRRDN